MFCTCNLVVLMLGRTEKQEVIKIYVECPKRAQLSFTWPPDQGLSCLQAFELCIHVQVIWTRCMLRGWDCGFWWNIKYQTTKGWSKGKIIHYKGKEDQRWSWDKDRTKIQRRRRIKLSRKRNRTRKKRKSPLNPPRRTNKKNKEVTDLAFVSCFCSVAHVCLVLA